jgi:hypothetical protein
LNPEAERSVRRAIASANAGDISGFLACFETSGCVDDWGRVFVGHDAIREWSDREFIGVNVSLDLEEFDTSADRATILAEVGGSGFNGASHFVFTAPELLIRSMKITG